EKPHTAVPAKISAAVATVRRFPRKPAHIRGKRARKPRRLRCGSNTLRSLLMRSLPMSGLEATIPMTPTSARAGIDSKDSHLEELRNGIIVQSRTGGTISKVPAASASHQVNQVTTGLGKPSLSARMNPARAMAELIIVVGAKQMIANLATLEAVANTC